MSYNYKIKVKDDHVRVEVSGKRIYGKEVENAVEYLSKVAGTCREYKINRILEICRVTGPFPTFPAFELAKSPDSFGWSREFKFAIVNLRPEAREGLIYVETVGVNRGYKVKLFDNEEEAIEWLMKD